MVLFIDRRQLTDLLIYLGCLGPHRLAARTPGSHPGNRSSILREVTKVELQIERRYKISIFYFYPILIC
jgi:hypothetical protein